MPNRQSKPAPRLSVLQRSVIELLQRHPEGLTLGEMAQALGLDLANQGQFGRRVRSLYPHYDIDRVRRGRRNVYILRGEKSDVHDDASVTKTLRAAVLHRARGTCAMCGRTIDDHGITLHVDHKVPRSWGGQAELDNLWALCAECNEGKKAFFSSVESPELKAALQHSSVHMRIGELLKAYGGKPVPSVLLEVIAGQSDWMKRLRELRYLGWKIEPSKERTPSGRVRSSYAVSHFEPWPADPTGVIRRYEIDRSQRRKKELGADDADR